MFRTTTIPPVNGMDDDDDDDDASCWCWIGFSSLELGRWSTGKQLNADVDPALTDECVGGGGAGG